MTPRGPRAHGASCQRNMSLRKLTTLLALVATAQAGATLHPNGDTAYCLDARGDASNGPTNPVKAFTYVLPPA